MNSKIKDTVIGYLFISPVILGILIFTLGPVLFSFYISFCEYDNITEPAFVGFNNYKALFQDSLFLKSLRITVVYAVSSIVIGLVLSFFLALLLNKKITGIKVFRTIFYTPVIVPAIAGSFVFADLFNVKYGVINSFITSLGFKPFPFLTSPRTALFSVIIFGLWGLGGSMLIWLAGFNGISPTYYEAAEIDGANKLRQLIKITIPMSTPIIFYNLILGIIGNLQAFGQVYILTNGGPVDSTTTIVLNIYNSAFKFLEMGYASAQAWVLFILILILTFVVFKTSSWVFYGDEGV